MSKITLNSAESLAKKFRSDNDLSFKEAINLKSLLRKLNILTVFMPLSLGSCGMCTRSNSGEKSILVNSATPKGRQHFTIAHELYHLYVEKELTPHMCVDGGSKKSVSEQNADMFASALLMPEDGLRSFISVDEITSRGLHLGTVIRMEQYFSVSRQALLFRLKNCRIITQVELEKLLNFPVASSAREYGYETSLYREGNNGLVIGDFGEKARILFERDIISEGHYRELLNLVSNEED